jgi:transcriptional regulator with XRE-family HTH domain
MKALHFFAKPNKCARPGASISHLWYHAVATLADVETEAYLRLDGNKVRRARERLGYSMETAAEIGGVSKNSVLRAEHGEDIRPLTARKIADALAVRVPDLVDEATDPKAQAPLPPFEELWEEALAVRGLIYLEPFKNYARARAQVWEELAVELATDEIPSPEVVTARVDQINGEVPMLLDTFKALGDQALEEVRNHRLPLEACEDVLEGFAEVMESIVATAKRVQDHLNSARKAAEAAEQGDMSAEVWRIGEGIAKFEQLLAEHRASAEDLRQQQILRSP